MAEILLFLSLVIVVVLFLGKGEANRIREEINGLEQFDVEWENANQ